MRYAILLIVSAILLMAWPAAAMTWYVNDADTTGDIYASAPGDTNNSGTSPVEPLLSPQAAVMLAGSGDTILVDRGTYDSVAFTITVDNLCLSGADSATTVFNAVNTAYLITATGRTGLRLSDFGCSGSSNGYAMYCDNVDSSVFERLTVRNGNGHGIYLYNGSAGNVVAGNYCDTMGGSGIHLHTSSTQNTIVGNLVRNCSTGGNIYLVNSNNNLISGNRCEQGTYGIHLYGSDSCTVQENTVFASQSAFAFENGCDSNLVTGNDFLASSSYGIYADGTGHSGNVFTDNAVTGGSSYALYAVSGNNFYSDNEFCNNAGGGIYLSGNGGTTLQNNRIASNLLTGIELFGTQSVYVRLNDIDSNGNNQVVISGAATTATIVFNNIFPSPGNPDSGIANPAGATADATRNWWGSIDSGAAKVSGSNVSCEPWRLNIIDTAPGADTVAPEPPAVVTCSGSLGTITLNWTASLYEENGTFHGGSGVAGYQIWRSFTGVDSWSMLAQVGAGMTTYADTGLGNGVTAWYQVFAADSHTPYSNIGWGDTVVSCTTAGGLGGGETIALIFYNAGYTTPIDAYASGDTAYLQLEAAMVNLDTFAYDSVTIRVTNQNTGDSEWVVLVETGMNSGVFRGSFRLSVADSIPFNGILFADSGHVVVADTGAAGQATDSFLVTAAPPSTAGPNVWYVNDADTAGDVYCSVAGDTGYNGLSPTSPSSSLIWVLTQIDSGDTVYIDAGTYTGHWNLDTPYVSLVGADSQSTILVGSGAFDVLTLNGCTGAVLTTLRLANAIGSYYGLTLNTCDAVFVDGVCALGNSGGGIRLQNGSHNVTLNGCEFVSNTGAGLSVTNSNNVAVYWCSFTGNLYGIQGTTADGLLIDYNRIDSSSMNGIDLPAGSDSAVITANRITNNSNCGISGAPGAEIGSNLFTGNQKGIDAAQGANITGNLFTGNFYGAYVMNSNVTLEANEFTGNPGAGIFLTGTPNGLQIQRNNLTGGDTAVICTASGSHNLTRNWWGTTDTGAMSARITGGMANNVQYVPFRYYPIDTAPAADRIAPATPDTFMAYGLDTATIRISWAAVTQDEDSSGACGDLQGYTVLRRQQGDTGWSTLTTTAATFYDDAGVTPGIACWYAVTAYDNKVPDANHSWMTNAAMAMTLADTTGPNAWYVNDGTLNGSDVHTIAIGVYGNSATSPAYPAAYLYEVLPLVSPGDTIYVDAGTFAETITVPCDSLAIIGAGSSVTTIDHGSTDTDITAVNRSGLLLQDLCVAYATAGVDWRNVSYSRIDNVQATWCGDGIRLSDGDHNRLTGLLAMDNTATGVRLVNETATMLTNSTLNMSTGSGTGLYAANCPGLAVVGNTASNNANTGLFFAACSGALISRNAASNNTLAGITDTLGVGNIYTGNEAYGNGTQFAQYGANSNTWKKNNLGGANGVYSDSAAAPLDFTGNWWSSTDTVIIAGKRTGPGAAAIAYEPYLLVPVDTVPEADTVAPQVPASVMVTGNDTTVTVDWDAPSLDEQGGPLSDLAGYHIWRNAGGSYMLVGDVPDYVTQFTDTTALHNLGYLYRVTAYDNAPANNESWYSAVAGPVRPNIPPVAAISADTIAGNATLVLTSASGDSDADGLVYYWWIESGSPGTLTSPTAVSTTCTGMAQGWYAFGLTVSDSYGGSDTAYHYVDIFDATVADTPTLTIAYGATYANSETVTVFITPAPGQEMYAYYMKIGTDPALTTGSWEPFCYTKEWGLTGGDGEKTLYVALGNYLYGQSGVASDSIVLDRVAPAGVNVSADSLTPAGDTVMLTFSTADSTGTVQMRYGSSLYVEGAYWDAWTANAEYWLDPYGDSQQVVVLQVQDAAGNLASDSVVLTVTASNFPQAASGFYGYGNDSAGAELYWSGSFSTNVTAYSIYSDSATGTVNYTVPVAVLPGSARAYTVSGLVPDTMYTFGIRVTDADGDTETNTDVLAWAWTYSVPDPSRVYAMVDYPIPGLSINGVIPVQAWVDGDLSGGAEVVYRYRSAGTANPWTYLGGVPDSPPYLTSWNTAGLADGDYELQAVARRLSNHADTDPYPASVIITKSAANAAISQTMNSDGDTVLVQRLNSNATDTQQIVAGSEEDPFEMNVPPSILGGNVTVNVKLFSDTAEALAGVDRTEFETGCTVIEVNFSNSQSTFTDSIVMKIPYDDANNDGIVDGTGIRVYLLRILYYSTTLNDWRVVPKADMTIDTVNRTVIVRVSHFSKFATGKVTLGGDLGSNNDGVGDGQVNHSDLARFNGSFGARSGNPHFNDAANIVRTGASANRVDEEDVFQMGANYGTSQ